ncbi:glycosyltransferase [Shewanella nanhaiensis]|uniref:Glycosyltransferase n=1 Tax=Shewanella nanhaiensis TaxID=2864872 RepID=A0ABS7E6A4_9GAMM|nr:glycosyltransferase [Shewanella nanhaiensis]MBW8185204.1 glycosyltransferase [Shewanella nanhaiensis]
MMIVEEREVLVSCILAVNRLDGFLPVAIDSILTQTYRNLELIIIANNCNEDLWSFLEEIKKTDSRIITRRTSIGQLVFNLNYGIDIARGKYIARMDADDISLPTRIEKQIDFLEKHKSVNMLATNFVRINIADEIISKPITNTFDNKDIRKELKYSNPIAHPSLMFRKCDVIKNRGYSWSFWAEDYEYHLRASRNPDYKFHCLSDVLLHYRVSDSQMTANNDNIVNYADESALLYREWIITGDKAYLLRIILLSRTFRSVSRPIKNVVRRFFVKKNH